MEKSMYSLILMDEVVRKIDELAHIQGSSRSGPVNQILAEHISFLTPQKRIGEIFGEIARVIGQGGQLQTRKTSANMMSITSALNYRYNPTIRYSVEITLEKGRYICRFTAGFRTQSGALRSGLSVFYEVWSQIETGALREKTGREPRFSMSGERFKRWLSIERDGILPASDVLGRAIGSYIALFDKALKISFAGEYGMDIQSYQQISALYAEHLGRGEVIL